MSYLEMNLSLILLLISIQLVLSQINELVILAFNSSYKPSSNNNQLSFIDNLQDRCLNTIINIGDPEYEILSVLSIQNDYLALIPNKTSINENNSTTKYNYINSKTFKNITCLNEYLCESRNDIIAQENFKIKTFNYLINKNGETILNDFNFILGINDKYKNKEYYLNIGLKMIMQYKNKEKRDYNFIYQLKGKNIINNYYWFLLFEQGKNNNEIFLNNPEELFYAKGRLIIGDLPSNYQPKKYHKNQLMTTYSYDKDLINAWGLEFNNIYHYNKKNKIVKDMYLSIYIDINNYLVQAPQTYYLQMKNEFFKDYLSKHFCNIYTGNGFEAIYCDKSENFTINNLKEFPVLYFQNNELQYIFEFNYTDFFVEVDNKFWFLVIFPTYYDVEEWYFGIIFLRKYNLIFNPDTKTISFYNPNLPIDDEEPNSPKKTNKNINPIIIIIIFILIILSIGLGIFLAKVIKYNQKIKKRFNELEDSFEYVSKDELKDENKVSNSLGIEKNNL